MMLCSLLEKGRLRRKHMVEERFPDLMRLGMKIFLRKKGI